jgi:taurine dioxygenase
VQRQFKFVPTSSAIGAEVVDVDLGALVQSEDVRAFDDIARALDRFLLLRFRQQTLTPQQIERLGRHFGPLLSLKRPEYPNAGHIEGVEHLKIISNTRDSSGKPLGDGSNAEQEWHTDGAMKPLPATYSYMYARQVPRAPPRTCWMNAYLLYEDLSQTIKDRVAGLKVIHHHYTAGNEVPLPPSLSLEERLRGPQHPLVRIHPTTRRRILYLPHRSDAQVVGLDEAESAELIGGLRRFAAQSPHQWGTALQVGDFVVWDNRPCLHRRDSWDDAEVRVVWHLANQGEAPIGL